MSDVIHKPLETSFRSNGHDYKQVKRVGDVAMFEQTKPGTSGSWYEVVVVQRHNGYTIAGKNVPPAETMPPASAWGKHGWTYGDKEAAEQRFAKMLSQK